MLQLNKNDIIELTIDSLANTGAGVARYDGMVVFVSRALPGERVRAQIIKKTKSYCVARMVELITPSRERTEAVCPYFGRCGGCVLQHLDYKAQLENKRRETEQVLRRISGIDFSVEHCCGMDEPYRYRNKAQLPVGNINGNTVIGFYASRSHNIINIESCAIQGMDIAPFIGKTKELLKSTGTSVYNEETHRGSLRHLMLRKSHKTGDIMAVLVTNEPLKKPEVWARELSEIGAVSVWNNINREKGNIILSDKCVLLGGTKRLPDELCGISFDLSPLSFLQVNPAAAEKLYEMAIEMAGLTKKDTVIDAYCGIGIMTQLLARSCKKAIGVEIVPDAIDNAHRSASQNKIENAEFIVGDCGVELPKLIDTAGKVDCLVLDPPRAGCDAAMLEKVGHSGIEKIVYVSCDAATLARDVKVLHAYGYSPVRTVCVDMFPQTQHVETVVLLSIKRKSGVY